MQIQSKQLAKEPGVYKTIYSPHQAASMLGISKQTLLRYEKKKIFPRPKRNPINKRREYGVKELEELKKIMGRL